MPRPGIGKEFARQIAASGINIVLVARREDLLKEVGVEFSKRFGVEHRVIVLDVSREDFIRDTTPPMYLTRTGIRSKSSIKPSEEPHIANLLKARQQWFPTVQRALSASAI